MSRLDDAVTKEDLPLVMALAENSSSEDLDYALKIASSKSDLTITQILVENGADVHAFDDEALRVASSSDNLLLVQYLVEQGADVHALYDASLQNASLRGYLPVVEYLVEHGANVNALNDEPLRLASSKGHLLVVRYLISHGANVHALNDTALRNASKNNHLPVVKFLVKLGADIHAEDDEAVREASRYGYRPLVEFLVDHGANIHALDDQAVRNASRYGHLPVVEFLVALGADIHARDEDALRMAAEYGHLSVVEFLVQKGADIHAFDDYALIKASRYDHVNVAEFLLQYDYPIDVIKRAMREISTYRKESSVMYFLKKKLKTLELVSTFLTSVKQGAYEDILKKAKEYYTKTGRSVYTDYMGSIVENASMGTLQFLINSFYYQGGFIKNDVLSTILPTVASEDKREYLERVLTEIAPYVDIQQFDDIVPDDFPDSPEECQVLNVVLGGSTGARLVQCGRNQYVRKQAAVITQSDFIYNEYIANQIYRLLGVAVPDVRFYTNKSTATLLSRYITPSSPLDINDTDVVEKIRSSFVVDAFLANWDVLGHSNDNVIVQGGIPYRVDNGGALFFRAKGAMKSVSQLTNVVRELDTMRTSIFGSLTNDQICKQIIHYSPLIESLIMPRIKSEVLRRVLGGRLEYMQKWGLANSTEPKWVIRVKADVSAYVTFFTQQLAYLTSLNMVMRQLVGEYIQVKEATDINSALCSGASLTPYQLSVYKTILNAFYGVPPIDAPLNVYRGIAVTSASFNEERLTCQFVSTTTDRTVAENTFAGYGNIILDITIVSGSKVLPLYGYFRNTPTLTSYEEDRNTYDTEMEVLLPPNGDWVRGGEYKKNGISYIEYTFST